MGNTDLRRICGPCGEGLPVGEAPCKPVGEALCKPVGEAPCKFVGEAP